MDSKVNFTLVGTFLFVFIIGLVSFTFWLGKYGTDSKKVSHYKVYLSESIAGLNIESSVKYKGLNIGSVKDIKISSKNTQNIEILLEVDGNSPIKEDTVAILESQGITGLKYIDLVGGSKNSTILKGINGEIPVIKSKPSFLGSLGDSAQDISQKVNSVLDKLNYLLNKENIQQLSSTLKNTNQLTSNINNTTANIDKFIDSISLTINKIDKLLEYDTKDTIKNINETSTAAKLTFEQLSKEIKNGKFDLKEITNNSLKRFDELLIEWDRTMENAEIMIDKYSDSPSDIIFKSRSDNFGPGEKNE